MLGDRAEVPFGSLAFDTFVQLRLLHFDNIFLDHFELRHLISGCQMLPVRPYHHDMSDIFPRNYIKYLGWLVSGND